MLKRLRFKNWRSLRDVTIDDLGPITVLIGANSSGKSNIVDGLRFLRRMIQANTPDKTYSFENRRRILTLGVEETEPIEIELAVQSPHLPSEMRYLLTIESRSNAKHFHEVVVQSDVSLFVRTEDGKGTGQNNEQSFVFMGRNTPSLYLGSLTLPVPGFTPEFTGFKDPLLLQLFITWHWQLLAEDFVPRSIGSNDKRIDEARDAYVVDQDAGNIVLILDFMSRSFPDIYDKFQGDFQWLLPHIQHLKIDANSQETRLQVFEPQNRGEESPTISFGTSRLAAVLAAIHALEMRAEQLPGLIVIEEPDMAIHPQLLKNFVELIRSYAEDEKHPRQFIFTTHNPRFLDHFQPEEVRVVERDEHGYTTVNRIPDYIREIWLDKYALGEVWMTRSFGGVPD